MSTFLLLAEVEAQKKFSQNGKLGHSCAGVMKGRLHVVHFLV